jgi:hypothetical protein
MAAGRPSEEEMRPDKKRDVLANARGVSSSPMPLHVTLHIHAGPRDPAWLIPDAEQEEQVRRLSAADPGRPAEAWVVDYAGFTVVDPAVPPDAPAVFAGRAARRTPGPGIEDILIRTGSHQVPTPILDWVRRIIRGEATTRAKRAFIPPCLGSPAADAPPYTPAPWNDPGIVAKHNCYAYAADRATDTFAQPGRAAGLPSDLPYDCEQLRTLARQDGLVPAPDPSAPLPAGAGHYVFLCLTGAWGGYHWYRQDRSGCWSHKVGVRPATDRDASDQRIEDPRLCDRGAYDRESGFFIVPPSVIIR